MKEFKVTKTMTKAYLGDVLNENLPVADLNLTPDANDKLTERVRYALTHISDKDTTRNDLANLVKELYAALGDKFVQLPVPEKPKTENLVKKPSSDKKKDIKSTDDSDVLKIEKAEKIFPETLTIEESTYVLDHSVKTMADLNAEDKLFEFAFYWTPAHLRKFAYMSPEDKQPKEFPNNLDTCQLFYVSDRGKVAYAVSDTTEAVYSIFPDNLEETDGIRYSSGCEFQIYSIPVAPENDDEEDEEDEDDTDEAEDEAVEDEDTEN